MVGDRGALQGFKEEEVPGMRTFWYALGAVVALAIYLPMIVVGYIWSSMVLGFNAGMDLHRIVEAYVIKDVRRGKTE